MFFKKVILPILLAAGVSGTAMADPFIFEFNGTIADTTPTATGTGEYVVGEPIKVMVTLDNGGNTTANQTWAADKLVAARFELNNGATIVTEVDGANLQFTGGNFATDANGALTAVPNAWADTDGLTVLFSNDPNDHATITWGIISGNNTWVYGSKDANGDDRKAALPDQTAITTAANWQAVPTGVSGNTVAATTNPRPDLSGTSNLPTGTAVTVTDANNATVCTATVSNGTWACTPDADLPVGENLLTPVIAGVAQNAFSVTITAAGGGNNGATAVPTLSEWAMILLVLMLGGIGYVKSRRFN